MTSTSHLSESDRLSVGQRVQAKGAPTIQGEVAAIDDHDGLMYFVMWDDGKGQERGLDRPATIETPLTVEPVGRDFP